MLAPTRSSFQQHVEPVTLARDLPPFSLPRGVTYGERMQPKDALHQLNNSQSGFVGAKVAYLVMRRL